MILTGKSSTQSKTCLVATSLTSVPHGLDWTGLDLPGAFMVRGWQQLPEPFHSSVCSCAHT